MSSKQNSPCHGNGTYYEGPRIHSPGLTPGAGLIRVQRAKGRAALVSLFAESVVRRRYWPELIDRAASDHLILTLEGAKLEAVQWTLVNQVTAIE